jgi:cytidylate kinase
MSTIQAEPPQSETKTRRGLNPPALIGISGLTGCGKTETLKHLVAALSGHGYGEYGTLDCGSLPRQWAREEGKTIDEYIATMGAELDPKIDDRTLGFYRDEPLGIVAGRLACHMSGKTAKTVFRVWLYCPAEVRASRRQVHVSEITGRDDKDSARFLEGYGLVYPPAEIEMAVSGILDAREIEVAPFDLLISTEKFSPQEIAERIVSCGRCWEGGHSYVKIHL